MSYTSSNTKKTRNLYSSQNVGVTKSLVLWQEKINLVR